MGAPLDNDPLTTDPLTPATKRVLYAVMRQPFLLEMDGVSPSELKAALKEVQQKLYPPKRPWAYRVRLTILVMGDTIFGSRPTDEEIKKTAIELARRGNYNTISEPEAIDVP